MSLTHTRRRFCWAKLRVFARDFFKAQKIFELRVDMSTKFSPSSRASNKRGKVERIFLFSSRLIDTRRGIKRENLSILQSNFFSFILFRSVLFSFQLFVICNFLFVIIFFRDFNFIVLKFYILFFRLKISWEKGKNLNNKIYCIEGSEIEVDWDFYRVFAIK